MPGQPSLEPQAAIPVERASERDTAFLSFFKDVLRDDPTLTIVDVGAQNLSGEEHVYSPLTRRWPHRIVGFEPVHDREIVEHTDAGVRHVLPVALGDGTSIFKGLPHKIPLTLAQTRQIKSGNILLTYTPD